MEVANSLVSCAHGQSVLGIFCVFMGRGGQGLSPSFVVSNADFALCLEVGLIPNMVHSGSVTPLTSTPLVSLSACDVSFHYNNGIMSVGVFSGEFFPSILEDPGSNWFLLSTSLMMVVNHLLSGNFG